MRILIIQLADIGDLVLATPALAALREAYPDAHITLLGSQHALPILYGTGLIDAAITISRSGHNNTRSMLNPKNLGWVRALWQGGFDTVLYFHHFTLWAGSLKLAAVGLLARAQRRVGLDNGRGWFLTDSLPDYGFGAKHQAQYWLDLVGLLGADNAPRSAQVSREAFPLPAAEVPRVVIHAGSGGFSKARRWPTAAFAQVADALMRDHAVQIVLVGGPDDDAAEVEKLTEAPVMNLSGQTRLAQLADLIAQADLFIGADSGVMHLAAAVGTPVLALFGPSNADAWSPWQPGGRIVVLRSAPRCSPCSYVEHTLAARHGCEARTCMHMITPARVTRAAAFLLSDDTPPSPPPMSAQDSGPDRDCVAILGLAVDALTYEAWLAQITAWLDGPPGPARQICTVNPEFMMVAQQDFRFRQVLARADLCLADGVGLLIAARMLGQRLPARVTGSDGVPKLADLAAERGWSLYLLGAAEGIAAQAAEVLQRDNPGLRIVGTFSGSPAAADEDALVARVNASGADVLLVAYGAPKQDLWIARNLPRLQVKMAMGVGGTFDFIAGVVPRAPMWMRRAGLEWLFRLYLEPRRITRQMRLPRFIWAVLRHGKRGKFLRTHLPPIGTRPKA